MTCTRDVERTRPEAKWHTWGVPVGADRRTLAIMSKGWERDDDYPGEYFELKCMWDNHFNCWRLFPEMTI